MCTLSHSVHFATKTTNLFFPNWNSQAKLCDVETVDLHRVGRTRNCYKAQHGERFHRNRRRDVEPLKGCYALRREGDGLIRVDIGENSASNRAHGEVKSGVIIVFICD